MSATLSYPSLAAVDLAAWNARWPHVNPETEWRSKGDGSLFVVPEFLDSFEELRRLCGFALPITSGYRDPAHDREVGTSTTPGAGPHTTGQAVDIHLSYTEASLAVRIALGLGFTGIGLKLYGPVEGHLLHLDTVHRIITFWTYP